MTIKTSSLQACFSPRGGNVYVYIADKMEKSANGLELPFHGQSTIAWCVLCNGKKCVMEKRCSAGFFHSRLETFY